MQTNLRPMSTGEILDRTAQLYRENFLLFAGIFAVYAGAAMVIDLTKYLVTYLANTQHKLQQRASVRLAELIVELALFALVYGISAAATCCAVAWVNLNKKGTIRQTYQAIFPRLGRYLGLFTLVSGIVWTPIVLFYASFLVVAARYAPTIAAGSRGAPQDEKAIMAFGALSIVFLILLIPVLIYTILMGLRYSLALPACVVEELPVRAAMKRSSILSKGSRGRIFMLVLLVAAVKVVFVLITQFFVFVIAFKHPGHLLPPWVMVSSRILAFITNCLLGPISAIGLTLFYYDQRIRKEGFDIEWLIRSTGMETFPNEEKPPAPTTLTADTLET